MTSVTIERPNLTTTDPVAAKPWHALSPEDVLTEVRSNSDGLGSNEVRDRIAQFGPNVLGSDRGVSVSALLLRQLRNPLVYLLTGSGTLALLLGKPIDGSVVLAVVVLNTLIGFFQ